MMRTFKVSAIFVLGVCVLLVNGCNQELEDCRIQNSTQQKRIDQLQADLSANELRLGQMKRQLDEAQQKDSIEVETLQQKVAALEEDRRKLLEKISSMQQSLLSGGAALPIELSTMLEDFAKQHDMVTYDSSQGIVKFKSDLTFEKGSDIVSAAAVEAVKSLCGILNSEEGKKFDVIIAGHTDDIPIQRPETRDKHPTNWHLSAHRGIAVLNVMEGNNIEPKRMSIRGFGEYRPIVENRPNRKGNPQNRRVEIYIVPAGV